jgi:hypothetical protein
VCVAVLITSGSDTSLILYKTFMKKSNQGLLALIFVVVANLIANITIAETSADNSLEATSTANKSTYAQQNKEEENPGDILDNGLIFMAAICGIYVAGKVRRVKRRNKRARYYRA